MYACFGNDYAWGTSSLEYGGSESGHIAFAIGNSDVSLERLDTTVSDDGKTVTVEYVFNEYKTTVETGSWKRHVLLLIMCLMSMCK